MQSFYPPIVKQKHCSLFTVRMKSGVRRTAVENIFISGGDSRRFMSVIRENTSGAQTFCLRSYVNLIKGRIALKWFVVAVYGIDINLHGSTISERDIRRPVK